MNFFDDDLEDIPTSCDNCQYCSGRNYDDGTPNCDYDGGYANCPYFEEGKIIKGNEKDSNKSPNLTIDIDLEDMRSRILIAYQNTLNRAVNEEVARIVKNQFEKEIRELTSQAIEKKIQDCVTVLFAQDVTVGGGWGAESKTMTREEYLIKTVGDKLGKDFQKDVMTKTITGEVERQISKFAESTRTGVNQNIKAIFDKVMQQNLTDSIVGVLMQNETYQRLNTSVQNLIQTK